MQGKVRYSDRSKRQVNRLKASGEEAETASNGSEFQILMIRQVKKCFLVLVLASETRRR